MLVDKSSQSSKLAQGRAARAECVREQELPTLCFAGAAQSPGFVLIMSALYRQVQCCLPLWQLQESVMSWRLLQLRVIPTCNLNTTNILLQSQALARDNMISVMTVRQYNTSDDNQTIQYQWQQWDNTNLQYQWWQSDDMLLVMTVRRYVTSDDSQTICYQWWQTIPYQWWQWDNTSDDSQTIPYQWWQTVRHQWWQSDNTIPVLTVRQCDPSDGSKTVWYQWWQSDSMIPVMTVRQYQWRQCG